MRRTWQRVLGDLRTRTHLDAYVVSACALVFCVLSLIGDVLSERLLLTALLAGVGLLVFRITLPERGASDVDAVLHDRTDFDSVPVAGRLAGAREVAVFAPSGINLLSSSTCEALRSQVLARADGKVRVLLLDPSATEAVRVAARQLDDGQEFSVESLAPSLRTVVSRMEMMRNWNVPGSFEYRLIDFSPGFSMFTVDPGTDNGSLIVEFHAVHGRHTGTRMHIALTRASSIRWHDYWIDQFEHLWSLGRTPAN
ncbi:hypothetical protein ABZ614_01780 [Streptomyces sp. NPDC013178]|uniref:hypothetical protein n=1 Tax=unclassified Streptomyces TaxID=2593676 RepID=UPI0033EDC61E